jgi:hypothetical protein
MKEANGNEDTGWQPLSLATGRLLLKLEDHSDADHRNEKPKGQENRDERAGTAAADVVIEGIRAQRVRR